jgi:pyruvate kinase
MTDSLTPDIIMLRRSVAELAAQLDAEATARRAEIEAALPKHRVSARNLAHYLGMRQHDVKALQLALAAVGLSSLGRSEGNVRNTVDWLSKWLSGMSGGHSSPAEYPDAASAEQLLHTNSRALFGPRPKDRHVYIMVTAPEAGLATEAWADGLIAGGANLLRINAAHESPGHWAEIIALFRARAEAAQVPVRVIVDLPGPKLRTEIVQREDGLLHLPRRKDALGRTLGPTRVQLVVEASAADELPVPAAWLHKFRDGDELRVMQPDGRERSLTVKVAARGRVSAETSRSLYVQGGAAIAWRRDASCIALARVGALPDQPRLIRLSEGDRFVVNAHGESADPDTVALALGAKELLAVVRAGERVMLDDGRIVAVVESIGPEGLRCRVTGTVKPAVRLRSGKGIAFPDTALSMPTLGEDDERALAFALEHADGVGVSFVNTVEDVDRVGERIRLAGRPGFGMILKLETRAALDHLPAILFRALRYDPVGLMIARGDLAMDVGFERLAEMQEELLWFGEACHLPVVWATQVLESVTHSGLPTRAEVTDAAMSMRAECVMLNRGPHVDVANRLLADIIRRMETHQFKKRSLYRRLSLAGPVHSPA